MDPSRASAVPHVASIAGTRIPAPKTPARWLGATYWSGQIPLPHRVRQRPRAVKPAERLVAARASFVLYLSIRPPEMAVETSENAKPFRCLSIESHLKPLLKRDNPWMAEARTRHKERLK
jgi:hypothetical protein